MISFAVLTSQEVQKLDTTKLLLQPYSIPEDEAYRPWLTAFRQLGDVNLAEELMAINKLHIWQWAVGKIIQLPELGSLAEARLAVQLPKAAIEANRQSNIVRLNDRVLFK